MKLNILKHINKIISKYIGGLEYIVTIVSADGSISKNIFKNIKDLNSFVVEINEDLYYNIQKIEKIRIYDLKYNKPILHTPVWFTKINVTELYNLDKIEYSFLKIDKSLTNVNRTHRN